MVPVSPPARPTLTHHAPNARRRRLPRNRCLINKVWFRDALGVSTLPTPSTRRVSSHQDGCGTRGDGRVDRGWRRNQPPKPRGVVCVVRPPPGPPPRCRLGPQSCPPFRHLPDGHKVHPSVIPTFTGVLDDGCPGSPWYSQVETRGPRGLQILSHLAPSYLLVRAGTSLRNTPVTEVDPGLHSRPGRVSHLRHVWTPVG